VPFDELSEGNVESLIIPTERVLPLETLLLTGRGYEKIFNGVPVKTDEKDGLYKIYREGEFYGLAEVKNSLAKVKTKLC
jgi:hypothetical protein